MITKLHTSICKKEFNFSKRNYFFFWTFFLLTCFSVSAQVTVTSVAELATVAAQSDQTVTMTPGVYNMTDYLSSSTVIANVTPADAYDRRAMIRFSGSNNTFVFTGVTINVDTALLNDLGGNVIEFHLTGNNINFKGLTVTDIGYEPTASGGQSFVVSGDDTVVENVTLNMKGSSPYGYGDLLGKGGGSLVAMRKHSGLLVGGKNVTIKGCSIYSESFGHLFFVQGGRNVLFEDCYAEAVTRTTDAMLAETSGPAFNLNFEAVYKNYEGNSVITPGYTKSLSEVGFRTYGSGAEGFDTAGVTLINCTARNARVGFALEVGGPILIQNCEATGCESGFNITEGKVENSRGDAVNGPLLYLSGSDTEVELELMPTLPTTIVHAVATISGTNHQVTLTKWNDETRTQDHKILVGATRPAGTNPFSPLGSETTSGITLNNCTEMPIEILSTTSASTINTTGSVINDGTGNTVITNSCVGIANLNFDDGMYTYTVLGTNPNQCKVTGFVSGQETATAVIPAVANNNSIPFSVVSVGDSAFTAKTIMTSVSLPSSVTSVGNDAFSLCTSLETINLTNIVTYGSNSFSGCSELALAPLDLTNAVSVGNYAFYNCVKITSVVVPGTVTFGDGVLRNTGITSFTIPSEWTVLPVQMIRDCKSITSINIPSTVTTMGIAAFRGCTGLTDVQVNWTTSSAIPSATVSNLFTGLTLSSINLLVPTNTAAFYEAAAVWTDFNIGVGTLSKGENKLTNSNVKLYPNPATNTVNISNAFDTSLEIYNIQGVLEITVKISENEKVISLEKLNSGVHFLKFTSNQGTIVKKLIKL
ncbi:putative secreted protein (Por secretion system target) [Mariniflexile fucanivorans]|uniref:Putative secreted protein (Por secretion system target) n=1 Tax=Mariniflexile fucanivorans TaxID=264023 RepID=A0A4R1RKL2_9FLAO|nr:leucine-rich repeat protein [Mariniflexile fucanivorans]TCL66252.1 putative secreted protein (Por secretion system target) [Mariniflexile fucanivorans]